MVEDFGSYLKAERKLRGVTLEELHTKTKIPIHYLQALEKTNLMNCLEKYLLEGTFAPLPESLALMRMRYSLLTLI